MGVYYIGSIPCSGGDIYHYGRKGMKWGKNIFGKISEFFTGNNARRELASATAQRNGARQQARALQGTPLGSAASAKQGWSNSANFGPINGKNYKMIYGTGEEQRRAVAQENYNRTLPGMIDQARKAMSDAREKVSKAYSDAASSLSGKGLDIQSFYSQVMQKAQGAINRGKSMVTKYGGQFVSQIETLGKNALTGGKSFLEGIMKKAKQAKSKATEPISRLKAREAEKRDRESEIGKKSNRDRNIMRSNIGKKYNKYMPAWNPNKPGRDFGGTFKDDGNYVPDDRYENNIANRTARFMGGQYEKYGPDTKKKKKK